MASGIHKLKPLQVTRLTKPGLYGDGGLLYLQVSSPTAKSWVFRYKREGRAVDMGLGSVNDVSLTEARDAARTYRNLKRQGIDPKRHRDAERASLLAEQARVMTFEEATKDFIKGREAGWKNSKHRHQWSATLETYAFPILGKMDVAQIETSHIHKVLKNIWLEKPETASRLRGRIERILGYATTAGYRAGDNPARWRGHLQNLLPARGEVQKVRHHAALPYSEIGGFIKELRDQDGVSALALEFLVLTGARTSEVTHAQWPEVDLEAKVWTVPAERMKAGKEHRVPLSPRAVEILKSVLALRSSKFVFPGGKSSSGLSTNAFRALLQRMARSDLTTHGFRSTFRDWIAEQTAYPHEVAEQALAHQISNAVERAYRRGDLFRKRTRLMDDWAAYCSTLPVEGNVIPLKAMPSDG